LHPLLAALLLEERVGNLDQDPRAIACFRIASRRAAMRQVDQNFEPLANDLVALLTADARNQSHAAGIMLIPWMIEPLWVRDALTAIGSFHGNLPLQDSFPSQKKTLRPCDF
jgi:hypothetical protein